MLLPFEIIEMILVIVAREKYMDADKFNLDLLIDAFPSLLTLIYKGGSVVFRKHRRVVNAIQEFRNDRRINTYTIIGFEECENENYNYIIFKGDTESYSIGTPLVVGYPTHEFFRIIVPKWFDFLKVRKLCNLTQPRYYENEKTDTFKLLFKHKNKYFFE